MYYKSYRIIDGKPTWVISDEDNDIIKDPTKEQIKYAIIDDRRKTKVVSYKNRKCCKCENDDTYIRPDGRPYWRNHKCDKKDCTEYLCSYCFNDNRKSNHLSIKKKNLENRTCCICESTETSEYQGGPLWYKDRSEYNVWTGKWICKKCYYRPVDKKGYFDDRICCTCGSDKTYMKSPGNPLWYKDRDKDWVWSKKWLCNKCYMQIRNNLPDSYNNIRKFLAKCRTQKPNINDNDGMVIISQAIVAKFLGIEDLNIKMNNFIWYIDMEDNKHGKINVKSSSVMYKFKDGSIEEMWKFATEKNISCDTYFCLGFSPDLNDIENVLIVQNNDEISKLTSITVPRNSKRDSKYDIFMSDDIKLFNDIYHNLDIDELFGKLKNLMNIDW